MNDRELLEMAAKAAGVDLWWDAADCPKELVQHWSGNPEDGGETRDYSWSPLTDDGDALRLVTALNLVVNVNGPSVTAGNDGSIECREWIAEGDRNSGVRRAIVRAAAEIGKAMP